MDDEKGVSGTLTDQSLRGAVSRKSQSAGSVCIECNQNVVEEEGDEICKSCWDAFIKAANDRRIARIKDGWTVDGTGAIHPPNATGQPRRKET